MANDLAQELQESRSELETRVDGHSLRFTSLDKMLWPNVAKREFLRYWATVAPYILPYLKNRPISMVRYPNGVGERRIFQRHWAKGLPDFVRTVPIYSESNRRPMNFLLVDDLRTLLWLGQMAVLEIHTWHSRVVRGSDARRKGIDFSDDSAFEESVLNYPDYLVCDLDPNFSGEFHRIASVAVAVKEAFARAGLECFVKTSGKRGLHVFAPIERTRTYDEVRRFARHVGEELERDHGDVTLEPSLAERPQKVFFDYSINSQSKTLACAYSPRGVDWAGVSFPLHWNELNDADPRHFTVDSVPSILDRRADAWSGFFDRRWTLGDP